MKALEFAQNGICHIRLKGVPEPKEIESLIEEYVTNVEVLPYQLRLILIDISELQHMGLLSRQVFSELLTQASKHYGGVVELVVAGGSINLQRFIQFFCKGIGFAEKSHFFATLDIAEGWAANQLTQNPSQI